MARRSGVDSLVTFAIVGVVGQFGYNLFQKDGDIGEATTLWKDQWKQFFASFGRSVKGIAGDDGAGSDWIDLGPRGGAGFAWNVKTGQVFGIKEGPFAGAPTAKAIDEAVAIARAWFA